MFNFHVYHHYDRGAVPRVLAGMYQMIKEIRDKMATIEELKAAVAANTEVTQSAVTLIGGLADKIEELKDDPEQLGELVTQLRADGEALAAAVSANTPPGPVTPPGEGEVPPVTDGSV